MRPTLIRERKMKKLLLSALALCMVLLISCKKDSDSAANSGGGGGGGNNPSFVKKIIEKTECYEQYTLKLNEDGHTWDTISQWLSGNRLDIFIWNDDKLQSIDHYRDDGILHNRDVFEHNSSGLVTRKIWADTLVEGEVWCYFYNNASQMIKFDYSKYYSGNITNYWADGFSWSNNKPDRIYAIEDPDGIKDNYASLIWTGDNLTRVGNPGTTARVEIMYDNKVNPFYCGNSLTPLAYYGDYFYMSKNNRLSQRYFDINGVNYRTITFTYEYDTDNHPVVRTKIEEEINEEEDGTTKKHVIVYHNTYTYQPIN